MCAQVCAERSDERQPWLACYSSIGAGFVYSSRQGTMTSGKRRTYPNRSTFQARDAAGSSLQSFNGKVSSVLPGTCLLRDGSPAGAASSGPHLPMRFQLLQIQLGFLLKYYHFGVCFGEMIAFMGSESRTSVTAAYVFREAHLRPSSASNPEQTQSPQP